MANLSIYCITAVFAKKDGQHQDMVDKVDTGFYLWK